MRKLQVLSKSLQVISGRRFLLLSFLAMIVSGAFIYPVNQALDGRMLDLAQDSATANALLAQMSDSQRSLHILWSVVGDTLYPLCYGVFLAGIAVSLSNRHQALAASPAGVTVLLDFVENTVHTIALIGRPGVLAAKDIVTPLKFVMFQLSVLLVLILAVIALFHWLKKRQKQ